MLTTQIEAILFAAAKPISVNILAKQFNATDEMMKKSISDILCRYNIPSSGIHLLEQSGKIQFVTNPEVSDAVTTFLKKDATSPLTKPSLETLTVIAYRGPITRPEIEQIRGVNCGLILRNLLIRGYIEEEQDSVRLQSVYSVSMEFMRKLGMTNLKDLPQYDAFHENENINVLLEKIEEV